MFKQETPQSIPIQSENRSRFAQLNRDGYSLNAKKRNSTTIFPSSTEVVNANNGTNTLTETVVLNPQHSMVQYSQNYMPTSLSQHYYSTITCHRRIFASLLSIPFLVVITPQAVTLITRLFDMVSKGYGVASLLLAIGTTVISLSLIRIYAPNQTKAKEVSVRYTYRIFLASLLLSLLSFRFLQVYVLYTFLGVHHTDKVSDINSVRWIFNNFLSFGMPFRIALGMTIVGAAVALRFVGWFAIVQCSCFPLPSNPIDKILRSLATKLSNFDIFLDSLVLPEMGERTSLKQTNQTDSVSNKYKSIRYRRPTIIQCSYQILLHAVAGGLFCHAAILPLFKSYFQQTNNMSNVLYLSSVIIAIATMCKTCLNSDTSHEILFAQQSQNTTSIQPSQPLHSYSTSETVIYVKKIASNVYIATLESGIIPLWIFTPLISCAGNYIFSDSEISYPLRDIISSIVISYITTLLLSLYMITSDILVRHALTIKGINIDRLVLENPPPIYTGDNSTWDNESMNDVNASIIMEDESYPHTYIPEDLILESILAGLGTNIYTDITSPNLVIDQHGKAFHKTNLLYASGTDLEENEMRRNDAMIERIGESMYLGLGYGFITLEEDILRLMILESMGGGYNEPKLSQEKNYRYPLGLSSRHFSTLQGRLLASDALLRNTSQKQLIILPIVRALSAYAGGFGEALFRSSNQWHTDPTSSLHSLSQSSLSSAEFSILSAARLIVLNFILPSRKGIMTSRYNHLSLMIPAILHSAFHLRSGILQYARILLAESEGSILDKAIKLTNENKDDSTPLRDLGQVQNTVNLGHFIASRCIHLKHVLETCDYAASLILQIISKLDGPRDAKVKVRDDCRAWLNSIVT